MQILKATQGIGLRVTEEAEDIGLDISEHGESMVVAHNQVCPAHTRSRGTARMCALNVGDSSVAPSHPYMLRHIYMLRQSSSSALVYTWLVLDTHS